MTTPAGTISRRPMIVRNVCVWLGVVEGGLKKDGEERRGEKIDNEIRVLLYEKVEIIIGVLRR